MGKRNKQAAPVVAVAAEQDGLPTVFRQRLAALLPPAHAAAVQASFAVARPVCVRANTLRAEPAVVAAALAELAGTAPLPLAGMPAAWQLPASCRPAVTGSVLFNDGAIYLQNPASLVPPLVLAPEPGMEVLDLAAAPGGKSIHLAQLLQNQGRLACVEAVRGRFFRLRANLERCGVTIAETYLKDGRRVGGQVPGRFDRVLLDAPCSSEARMRAGDPGSFSHWSERKVRECARKQRGLLLSALQAVAVGGELVYCTCSFAPEENERVLAWALQRFDGSAEVVPVDLPAAVTWQPGLTAWQGRELPPEVAGMRRILPLDGFDGMVLVKLRRLA